MIRNIGFDSSINHWERPYGDLKHTTSVYHTGPGAAQLITSDETGFLEYRGNMGQCVDLSDFIPDWPLVAGEMIMTLEAYVLTGAEITNVSLNGIFVEDTHCGTGLIHAFEIPPIGGSRDWTRLSGTTTIPTTARSLHVFISATGTIDSVTVYVDDIQAYATVLSDN